MELFIQYQSLIIVYAYLLDLLLGDPRWLPHPVKGIGLLIKFLEKIIRRFTKTDKHRKVGGIILLLTVVCIVVVLIYAIIRSLVSVSYILYFAVSVFLAYTTIGSKDLYAESLDVLKPLLRGDLDRARDMLGRLVGRDTGHLTREAVCMALIESVSENTSDGVVAPLFYLAIGGLPLAFAYKAVNTLDSMVGYRDDKYRDIGRASARADDLLNYIPARITGVIMVVVSFLLRFDWRRAIFILKRDGRRHPSPNAGIPEAATAGALRVRVGGGGYYSGIYHPKPHIGDCTEAIDERKVFDALRIMHFTSLIMVFLATLLYIIL